MIRIAGLDNLVRRIANHADVIAPKVDKALTSATVKMRNRAVKTAPEHDGHLRRGIIADNEKFLRKSLSSTAKYSPFVEFGTKSKVQVPPELTEYAMQFKGIRREGDFEQFVEQLAKWVKDKGIAGTAIKFTKARKVRRDNVRTRALELAIARNYAIAIIKYGIRPQPSFFPAIDAETDPLLKEILKAIGFED